ncbi:MAG: hypothetical protein LCH77_08435 [Actinobacteria bacterium]|nr:hypothetical protein [Actinomycetota bacterium]
MPPVQPPGPGPVLDRLALACDDAVDGLLDAMPMAGDRALQGALDDYLDALMDALRMLAAVGREASAALPVSQRRVALSEPLPSGGPERERSRSW